MLCVSGFEIYSRWVPLIIMRVTTSQHKTSARENETSDKNHIVCSKCKPFQSIIYP